MAPTREEQVLTLEQTGKDQAWDRFVSANPMSSMFQASGWRHVLSESYGLDTHFLYLEDNGGRVVATLPLAATGNALIGYSLTSLPYLDYSGVTAADSSNIGPLLEAAANITRRQGCKRLEIRSPLRVKVPAGRDLLGSVSTGKIRPLKTIDQKPSALLQSLKAKLRSQIKRPQKAGLTARSGAAELLDDFYRVFLENMRDLGSPVHGLGYFQAILRAFPDNARVFVVHLDGDPLAASILLFNQTLAENPWSSSLRRASKMSPNMLLYWAMLSFCAENSVARFSFGRSSRDSGTYRFKQQWGVEDQPLYWYRPLGPSFEPGANGERSRIASAAITAWQRLPVSATRVIGPRVRRYISL